MARKRSGWQGFYLFVCVFRVVDLNVRKIRMAVNPDHVHIFYIYPPKLLPSVIVKKFKNYTSLSLRKEFPELKKRVRDHLWARSNYHGSVGIALRLW